MQYNENRKRSANSAISNAITRINACKKSTNIKIPSDFEGAGTIRAAIEMIKGVSISGIQQDFRSAINELEANESEEKARASGFSFKVGGSNLSRLSNTTGSNSSSYSVKNDNHNVYHEAVKLSKSVNKTEAKSKKASSILYDFFFNPDKYWGDLKQQTLSTQKEVNQKLKLHVEGQAKKNTKIQTSYERMINNLNKKTEKTTKQANKILVQEQKKRKEETERVQASAQNTLVSTGKGLVKMAENISDFIALRTEKMQENHLRTIYSSNTQYKEMYGEQYEKEIEQMRENTMANVEKNYTEAIFNKLYEENTTLKEINEKAYNPFKTTGVVYKIGEQVAPAVVATGAMVVAPEAAPVIVPFIIGMSSGGRSSEEYLYDKKMNSKEGIEQAYKDGQITKEEYDSYKYIWNLSAEEFSIAMNCMENQTNKDRLFNTYFMSDKWTKEENQDEAITYGNAVGLWDAAQYALGMNLFKFNPTNSALLNSSMRVGVDTGLNASDTPYKAFVRSAIDKDTDFETEFKKLGGWGAVGTSAALGFAGSVLGELGQNLKANSIFNKILEMQDVGSEELDNTVKAALKNDIISGKVTIEDANIEDFLSRYSVTREDILTTRTANMICEIQNIDHKIVDSRIKKVLEKDIKSGAISLDDAINDSNFLAKYVNQNNLSELLPVENRISMAQNCGDEFLREHGILWMKKGKKQTDNIIVFSSRKKFEKYLTSKLGYSKKKAKTIGGVNCNNGALIVLPNYTNIETIVHEGNHSIGWVEMDNADIVWNFDCYVGENGRGVYIQRGINEAFTESINLRMSGLEGTVRSRCAYSGNVGVLNKMIDMLNENGYTDIDLYTYFGYDKTLFAKTVNSIMEDDNFYNQMARDMNIADGCVDAYSKADIDAAKLDLVDLLDRFAEKIYKK